VERMLGARSGQERAQGVRRARQRECPAATLRLVLRHKVAMDETAGVRSVLAVAQVLTASTAARSLAPARRPLLLQLPRLLL
jgi:hypothetical protein